MMELADQERWAAEQDLQSPKGWSYKDLAEDSNASLASGSQMQRTHSNFSAISRATSVATSLISRTHSTFLQKHKKFGLKRKSLWDKIVENPWFNRLVLAIIMANCVFLAIANPQCDTEVEIANNPECAGNPKWQRIIDANYFFTAAFSIEVVVQAIAKNFIIGPNAYLKNGWSWLDFITTLTSYTPYLPGNATDVSSLRAFRALRPLRTLSAHPGIRLLVSTLISAIPLLLDVVLLLTWVFFVFGIIGMQLFMGRLLGRCHPLNTSTLQPEAVPENMTDQVCNPVQSSGTYNCGDGYVCLNGDYEAFYGDVSFDNIGRALLQVLQVVSLESWSTTQMYYLLDGIGNVVFIYYFCLIVIGTYFALNLLVAVISAKFAQLHVDSQKAILARDRAAPNMSANVRFYIEFLVSMLLKREDLVPWAEQSYPRRVARRIVDDPWFNRFVMSIVLVNIVIMALYHADMSDGFADALETTNLVLTILFTIEMVIKHAALGILGYWSNGFNALDGIIVIASLVDLGLQYSGITTFTPTVKCTFTLTLTFTLVNVLDSIIVIASLVELGLQNSGTSNSHGGGGVSSLRVLRLLRVLRSLKLLRQVEGLNKIVNVVLKSMVALRDFMLLLLLFIFIFMVLGIQLFGGNSYYTPANTATWRKGFASFYESFYTLFEALTGESWTGNIWNSMAAVGPAACLFWIAWDIIGHKILLNLFLAILINNFQDQEVGPQLF
ncbi:MAG: voltage-gated ion channel superfamily [Trebouxia sp. A1-2]|nr:MAG: voltage-gated ion channel superfamily [Trebouxia sp. A1-2]